MSFSGVHEVEDRYQSHVREGDLHGLVLFTPVDPDHQAVFVDPGPEEGAGWLPVHRRVVLGSVDESGAVWLE